MRNKIFTCFRNNCFLHVIVFAAKIETSTLSQPILLPEIYFPWVGKYENETLSNIVDVMCHQHRVHLLMQGIFSRRPTEGDNPRPPLRNNNTATSTTLVFFELICAFRLLKKVFF